MRMDCKRNYMRMENILPFTGGPLKEKQISLRGGAFGAPYA
jgi:hypothetical protein